MSVLHLLGSAADGGAETYFLSLVRALQADGLSQAAAIRRHATRQAALNAAGVAVRPLHFGGPLDIFTRPGVADFARRTDARLLLAWMNRAARHAPRGPWARIGRLGGYYKLKYYRGFDGLVANTQDIRRWVIEHGWPADKVRYIPNFAEAEAGGAAQNRAALDTPLDAPLLLSPGRLHPSKAHDVGLKALAKLPQAYLWIAGSGPLDAQLRALAVSLGVVERVRFLGWRNDMPALYRAADVCLFPSRFEPLGNVVIQAWAHGLPVVAAASQGPAGLIRDGQDGLLAPVDDAAALAALVRRVIEDIGLAKDLAAHGARRVAAEFSQAAVVAQWRTLFAEYGAG